MKSVNYNEAYKFWIRSLQLDAASKPEIFYGQNVLMGIPAGMEGYRPVDLERDHPGDFFRFALQEKKPDEKNRGNNGQNRS